jgi:hypothetical protein
LRAKNPFLGKMFIATYMAVRKFAVFSEENPHAKQQY